MVEFTFPGVDALGPRENIVSLVWCDINIRMFRSFRTQAFPHQPQQALNGAILGMETILEMTDRGQPAAGYRFRLYKNGKLAQKSTTDQDGRCGDIAIDLGEDHATYRLSVSGPLKRSTRRKHPS
jgi:hypothetical protein